MRSPRREGPATDSPQLMAVRDKMLRVIVGNTKFVSALNGGFLNAVTFKGKLCVNDLLLAINSKVERSLTEIGNDLPNYHSTIMSKGFDLVTMKSQVEIGLAKLAEVVKAATSTDFIASGRHYLNGLEAFAAHDKLQEIEKNMLHMSHLKEFRSFNENVGEWQRLFSKDLKSFYEDYKT